jgi:uncharacterized membrane protein
VPLIVALLALRFDHSERPTPVRALGLLMGFGGVVALVGIDIAGKGGELLGAGAILLAAVGYAIGPMLIKLRMAELDPRATMGASLAIASVLLAPAAALDRPPAAPSAGAIACVIALGLVCTAAAFVIFSILITEAGTSRATVITYVNPVIAVGLGVTLLGERPGAGAVAGLLLILAGSWLATDGRLPPGLGRLPLLAGRMSARSASRGLRQESVSYPSPRARAGFAPLQEILLRINVLTAKAIANPIVHRFRLRSTREPPPSGPAPVPTPNAPDSPESLPECIRIRNTSTTAINTCRMSSSVTI